MRVAVFGLGYVGCVTAACLARDGHRVTGVDIDREKLRLLERGRSPITEPGLEPLLRRALRSGRFTATGDGESAVRGSDASLICVGTPARRDGTIDLRFVRATCRQIGRALRNCRREGEGGGAPLPSTGPLSPTPRKFHVVAIRSTVLPGSTEGPLREDLERASGLRAWEEFGLCVNPEFLREGMGIRDFDRPPHLVFGTWEGRSLRALETLYAEVRAPRFRVDPTTAEMVKYGDNAFRALKVVFANEMGALAGALGVDGHRLMEILARDRQVNISPAHLRPGLPYGGACLPKDVNALVARGRQAGVRIPFLEGVVEGNRAHLERCLGIILRRRPRRVALLGLSFKAETLDLRGSPGLEMAVALRRRSIPVALYDPRVPREMRRHDRAYLEERFPGYARCLKRSAREASRGAGVVALFYRHPEFDSLSLLPGQALVDFSGRRVR